ncbi:MAG: hypothetical protein ACK4QL_02500 [Pseudanabaenaceae cyanobacterium]
MTRLLLLLLASASFHLSLEGLVTTPHQVRAESMLPGTKPPKPARMSSSLIKKLENLKQRKFTEAEKQELHKATQKMEAALKPSHEKFIQEVARISLVSVADVRQSVMKPGQAGSINSLIIKLNTIGGRAINNQQRAQLEVADRERKKQVLAVREQYAKDIAKITGLTPQQVMSQLPKVGL